MTARTISTEFSLPNRRRKNQRSPVRWIISLALPYWVLVLTTIIGAFGNAALAAVIPIVIGMAFNAIQQTPPNTGFLPVAAFWIVVSQIIRGGLQFVRNFSAELLGQRLERDIREELYVSLLGKSMAFHSLQPVGDTMARATNDVREINYMFSPGLKSGGWIGKFLDCAIDRCSALLSDIDHRSSGLYRAVFPILMAILARARSDNRGSAYLLRRNECAFGGSNRWN